MNRLFFNARNELRSGWKVAAFFLVFKAVDLAFAVAAERTGHAEGLGPWSAAAVGALTTWLCLKLEGRPFTSVGLVPGRRWLGHCLAGTLGGILLILAMALVVRGFDGFHWQRSAGVGLPQLLASAWMLLGVGFNEEIIARGYPFQRLVEGAGTWVGQLVFAAIFAFGHWSNPGMEGSTLAWATLNIGLAAILLGFCYLRPGSLALPIGVHLGWNWAQGSLLGFGVSGTTDIPGAWIPVFHGKPAWLTGGTFGLEASLPCAVICAVVITLLWRWKGSNPNGDASTASAS